MAQLRQQLATLDQTDIDAKVITFDSEYLAKAYIKETQLEWPLLLDSEKSTYEEYGMSRGGFWSLYGPVSIYKYIDLIFFKGQRGGRPGSDWQRLGGNIVIDPSGIVRLHHVSKNPHDRPPVESIVELVAQT